MKTKIIMLLFVTSSNLYASFSRELATCLMQAFDVDPDPVYTVLKKSEGIYFNYLVPFAGFKGLLYTDRKGSIYYYPVRSPKRYLEAVFSLNHTHYIRAFEGEFNTIEKDQFEFHRKSEAKNVSIVDFTLKDFITSDPYFTFYLKQRVKDALKRIKQFTGKKIKDHFRKRGKKFEKEEKKFFNDKENVLSRCSAVIGQRHIPLGAP